MVTYTTLGGTSPHPIGILKWRDNGAKGNVDPSSPGRNDLRNGAHSGADGRTPAHGPPGGDHRWLLSVVQHSSEIVTVVDPDGTVR